MPSSLKNSFSEFCNKNKFEINKKQTEILNSLEKFIFSRNKLLKIIIEIGINDCKNLLFVSRGINIAVASKGEKLGGKPINLLTINIITKYKRFLFIS